VGGLQTWPDSPELEAVLAPFSLVTNRKLPTEDLIRDDLAVEVRCNSAFAAVQVASVSTKLHFRGHAPNLPRIEIISRGMGTHYFTYSAGGRGSLV
jgi:hypothetical protein